CHGGDPVGAAVRRPDLPAKRPGLATHIQMKNKSFKCPAGVIGYAIRDIWRFWKCAVVIEQFRGVLV
ncbi:hypothetical protein NPS52_21690, partial [Pseudomonas putida]|uniref:hypothetical protein n=1 Tax=Pseudomonas putida TaxID=303 RepID=UPI0023641001